MLWISQLLLRSRHHARRMRAIAGLGKSGRAAAIANLIDIALGHSPRAGAGRQQAPDTAASEQTGARAALVHLGPSAVPQLIAVYQRSQPAAQAIIVQFLGEIGGEAALAVVNRAVADADAELRRSSTLALAHFPAGSNSVVALDALLADPDAGVKAAAATTAGRLGISSAVEPLIQLLADRDTEVRNAAATALGQLGAKAASEPLLLLLYREGRALTAVPIVRALFQIGTPRAVDATTNFLHGLIVGLDPTMGATAVALLKDRGWQATTGPEILAVAVLSWDVRELIYPMFRTKEALAILRDKLEDPAWAPRRDWVRDAIAQLEQAVRWNDCPHDGAFDSGAPNAQGESARRCRRCGKPAWEGPGRQESTPSR